MATGHTADNGRPPDDRSFAQLLHDALIAKGWTRSKLADELHVVPSTVSKWLAGHRPDPEMASRIEKLLGCEPGTLREPLEKEIRERDRRTATGRSHAWDSMTCPYQGQLPFKLEHARFFHGRSA